MTTTITQIHPETGVGGANQLHGPYSQYYPESSGYENIKLRECAVIAVIFFVCAQLGRSFFEWRLELGGVGIFGSKNRRIFPI